MEPLAMGHRAQLSSDVAKITIRDAIRYIQAENRPPNLSRGSSNPYPDREVDLVIFDPNGMTYKVLRDGEMVVTAGLDVRLLVIRIQGLIDRCLLESDTDETFVASEIEVRVPGLSVVTSFPRIMGRPCWIPESDEEGSM
jgi:hypothetical protein